MAIHSIMSLFTGTFHRSAAPGQLAFKNVGDRVQAGDVVGLIEAMNHFSEINAEVAGKLMKFHVENESMVASGVLLFDVETR